MKSERKAVLVGVGVPLLLLVALLVWGTMRSQDRNGRPGVNSVLGEVPVSTDPFNDFEIVTLEGSNLRLSDLRGDVVVVDFWTSWCAPCRAEAPILAEAAKKWSGNGVSFVGIAIWDDPQAVSEFVGRFDVEYPIGIDGNGSISVDFGVRGIPEKFFVKPDGEIVRKIQGPNTARSLDDVLAAMVEEAGGFARN